jgi:hypothetical protein
MNISRHFLNIQFLVMSVVFTASSVSAENTLTTHNTSRSGIIYNSLKAEIVPFLKIKNLSLSADGTDIGLRSDLQPFFGFVPSVVKDNTWMEKCLYKSGGFLFSHYDIMAKTGIFDPPSVSHLVVTT